MAVHWRVVGAPKGREIEINSGRGYCVDREPPPKFEKVSVVSRGRAVYLTPFVAVRKPSKVGICSGVGYAQYGVVKLPRPVRMLRVFDASTRPPELRWPDRRPVPVAWEVGAVSGPSTVQIVSDVGYCVGDPRPRFGRIAITRHGSRVYIKPFVINAPPTSGPCRGVGYFEKRAIDLGDEIQGLQLYDATTEPPTLRWPRG